MPGSIQRATVNTTAGNTTAVVAAVAGKQIFVHGFAISASAANTIIEIEDSGGGSLSGDMRGGANATVSHPLSHRPLFAAPPGLAVHVQATTGNATGYLLYSVGF